MWRLKRGFVKIFGKRLFLCLRCWCAFWRSIMLRFLILKVGHFWKIKSDSSHDLGNFSKINHNFQRLLPFWSLGKAFYDPGNFLMSVVLFKIWVGLFWDRARTFLSIRSLNFLSLLITLFRVFSLGVFFIGWSPSLLSKSL